MCYECQNIIAISYENEIYSPLELLESNQNFKNVENGIKIQKDLILVLNDDKKNYEVIIMLNELAIEEDGSFLRFKQKCQKIILLYDNSSVIGYIIWTENEDKIILRQIYIHKPFRCKAYGTILIKEWFKNVVLNNYSEFGVESPNRTIIKILIKLGYFSLDDNTKNISYFVYSG